MSRNSINSIRDKVATWRTALRGKASQSQQPVSRVHAPVQRAVHHGATMIRCVSAVIHPTTRRFRWTTHSLAAAMASASPAAATVPAADSTEAPPEPAAPAPAAGLKYSGVVFDMDGTLTQPNAIDFAMLREKVGARAGEGILEAIDRVKEAESAERADELMSIVEEEEHRGAAATEFMEGVHAMLDDLEARGVRRAIVTRNNSAVADLVLGKLGRSFDMVLTREFQPPKPDPHCVHHISERWGLDTSSMLFVGDHSDDMMCGNNAGTSTCLIGEPGHPHFDTAKPHATYTVRSLLQVVRIVDGEHHGDRHAPGTDDSGAAAGSGTT